MAWGVCRGGEESWVFGMKYSYDVQKLPTGYRTGVGAGRLFFLFVAMVNLRKQPR